MKIASGAWKIILFVAVFAVGVGFAYQILKPKKALPVYQPSELNPKLVDESLRGKNENHTVLNFELTNQLGEKISLAQLSGKVYVADFFFTNCKSICPKMTTQLLRVAEKYKGEEQFKIVSHTVDPENDDVAALKNYSEANNIDPKQWIMLTGPSKEIYHLARKSYFAVLDEPSKEGPDFVHTENFILVDTKGRLRGFYDGTSPEEVDQLIEDIALLLEEKTTVQ